MSTPTIGAITRHRGIAGQFQLNAQVTYEGEPTETHGFVSNTDGGPIVAVSPSGVQTFVVRAVQDRCGSVLSPAWIKAFYAPREV